MENQPLPDTLGAEEIPGLAVDWEAVTSHAHHREMEEHAEKLDPDRTIGDPSAGNVRE